MKKIRQAAIILCIVTGIILGNGCQKKDAAGGESSNATEVSAGKNSFKEVTSKLDKGGNLYVYLSTEEWLNGLSQKVEGWRGLANNIPNLEPADEKNVGKVFDVVTSLIHKSGVEDVSGAGMISTEREKGFLPQQVCPVSLSRQRHGFSGGRYAGKSPHACWTDWNWLPGSTVLATFTDMDLAMLAFVVEEEIGNAGIPGAKEEMQKLPDQFAAATGLQLDKVLASLGNEYGLVITLDDAKKISIPFTSPPMDVPEPGIMLVIKVKDDTIFKTGG